MKKLIVVLYLIAGTSILNLEAFSNFDNDEIIEIPIGFTGKLIVFKAIINGYEGFVCFDTGQKGLILNDQFFHGRISNDEILGIDNRSLPVQITSANFDVNGHSRYFKDAFVAPIDEIWPKGTPIIAIVGWELFQDFVVLLDYAGKKIKVIQKDQDRLMHLYDVLQVSNIKRNQDFLILKTGIEKQNMDMILDTGAEVNVLNAATKFKDKFILKKDLLQISGFSGRNKYTVFQLRGLHLESYKFPSMRTIAVDLWALNSELDGSFITGILGFEFLRNQPIVIDLINYKIFICRNISKSSEALAFSN